MLLMVWGLEGNVQGEDVQGGLVQGEMSWGKWNVLEPKKSYATQSHTDSEAHVAKTQIGKTCMVL